MFSVKDLSFTAGGKRILDAVTFAISEGSNVAVIGKSGSGKSALLSALSGSIRTSGSMTFADHGAKKSPARIILYPGNCPARETDSVSDTVCAGRALHKKPVAPYSPFDIQSAEEKIREFGLDSYRNTEMDALPDALYKMTLLAHYFVYDADILLIDNPEEALDVACRAKLTRAVQKYTFNGRRAVLFATNDLTFASHTAEHFLVLDSGRIVMEGGHEIFTETLLKNIFGCEAIISKNIFNGRPEVQIIPEA